MRGSHPHRLAGLQPQHPHARLRDMQLVTRKHEAKSEFHPPLPAATMACLSISDVSPATMHPGTLVFNIIGSTTTSPLGLVSSPNCWISSCALLLVGGR